MKSNTTVNSNIKTLLKRHNKTQKELADHIKVSKNTVSEWTTGKNSPSVQNLYEIRDFFDISFDYLLYGTENIEEPKEVNINKFLSADEITLLETYRKLNSRGKCLVQAKVYEEMDIMNGVLGVTLQEDIG